MKRNNVPDAWRRKKDHYRLSGVMCYECERAFVPARQVCPWCGSDKALESRVFSGRGEVISYTTITDAPSDFVASVPYAIALIELENGARITAPVVDLRPDEIRVGLQVEKVFRRVYTEGESGLIEYGTKFRPMLKKYEGK